MNVVETVKNYLEALLSKEPNMSPVAHEVISDLVDRLHDSILRLNEELKTI